jgi:hypothetical protein
MTSVCKCLTLILTLVASTAVLTFDAFAIDKDKKFAPPAIESVPAKLTVSDVTIAAIPFESESEAETAFGKIHPYEHGVLPVLVMIRNDSKGTIRLDGMKVEYHDKDRQSVDATPPNEVPYIQAPRRPKFGGPQIPGISRKPKNKLAGPEIEIRAFAAKVLPPGESAHGFFYFRTGHRSGAMLYVTGLQEASTGKDLFYYEIPLD